MKVLKKTYSKNNNEIVLAEKTVGPDDVKPVCPTYDSHTVLVIGVFHGDEPQGKFLIENYLKNSLAQPKNRLLFIPCLNPDGLMNLTRQNANRVDLNRNFPTENWELTELNEYYGGNSPASEIETKFVTEIIEEYSPDVILTLHAPYKIVNFDGPAKEIAQKISEIIGYPAQEDIGYPTPGSFGTYAGIERNIPTITLELDEKADIKDLEPFMTNIFDYLALH